MTPYISHRSTFIIFIISINIVSVVCSLYEPIKENPVIDDNQRKFTYFNYLRAPSQYPAGSPLLQVENLKKLDVDQYYKAYYRDKVHVFSSVDAYLPPLSLVRLRSSNVR
ncbi:unnamed protein product [Macrosiphum euphorbiae]|uniref:Uncharacterized protein n=1 Tax=Macrosiphum euphorbiae TaxID=13131 RepID=A0AAV0W3E4_9HEMI|nr:unnamed protein product [Macrosiphum euphorbiae]